MSPQRKFDRFMVAVDLGSNGKVGRLTDAEFRCLVTGIWALAAKAPIRGALLIGEHQATADDVARQAHCSPNVARSTLAKMRELGLLDRDDELGCEVVHDWADINPDPKSDATAAARMQRYRARLKARNGAVTAVTVTPPVTPQQPSEGERGKVVSFNRRPVPAARLSAAEAVLADFNEQARMSVAAYTGAGKPSDSLTRIISALTSWPDRLPDVAACHDLIAAALASRWWGDGPPSVGVVFGPKVIESNFARVAGGGAESGASRIRREMDEAAERTARKIGGAA